MTKSLKNNGLKIASRGYVKPLLLMVGSAIVTVGALAYPASLYICSSVYDRQMEILQEKYGAKADKNVVIGYDEQERNFTGRKGVFTVTYYALDSKDAASEERQKLLDLRFKADTSFGLMGFTTNVVPDKEYGSFPEFSKYMLEFPSLVASAHYVPWSDKISYQGDVGSFAFLLKPDEKNSPDKLVSTGIKLNMVMDRDGRFTSFDKVMEVIDKGGSDFDFDISSDNLRLTFSSKDAQADISKDIIGIDLNGVKYGGTMVGGMAVNFKTDIKELNLFGSVQGNIDNLHFAGDLLRSRNTYGLSYDASSSALSLSAPMLTDKKYQFTDIKFNSAFVDMDKDALFTMLVISSSEYMKRLGNGVDNDVVLQIEDVMDRGQNTDFQWDLNNFSFRAENNGQVMVKGHLKGKILAVEDEVPNFSLDVNFDQNVVSYLMGKEAANYLGMFSALGYLKETSDEKKLDEKQYFVNIQGGANGVTLNGKKFHL